MPPLLAALLMVELGCTLSIIEAIDLGVEWRMYEKHEHRSLAWYDGFLGRQLGIELTRGTYTWPVPLWSRRF
jgi:hypothetical protein